MKYSKTILVTMPAFGHSRVLDAFKDQLQENANVYFFPGNLSTLAISGKAGISERGITFVEFNSLPYGCRVSDKGVVKIGIRTSLLTYAAFPARNTDKVVDEIEQLYPGQRRNKDILEVSLNNPNPLIHPPGVLLNLGRIEHAQGQFYMYNEGMTDSVLRVIKAVDAEREEIGHKLGYQLISLEEFGGVLLDGTKDSFIDCGKSAQMLGPCDRNNRYLTEDVPFGLTYWREIARKIGVSTPNIDAVTTLTSAVCDLPANNQLVDKIKSLPDGVSSLRDYLYERE